MAKVAAGIRQVVSTAILFELRDPRVANVTVLGVDVAPDYRTAKVRVTIMGDEKQQRLALKGLESARGFLQSRIADELDLRYTPVLTIVRDEAVKKSIAVAKALRELAGSEGDQQNDMTDKDGAAPADDQGARDDADDPI
jgi:ribosome-binding factor A